MNYRWDFWKICDFAVKTTNGLDIFVSSEEKMMKNGKFWKAKGRLP